MTTSSSPESTHGIFSDVEQLIDEQLQVKDCGKSKRRYGTVMACQRLSGRSPPDGFSADRLIILIFEKIRENYNKGGGSHTPSPQNWRHDHHTVIAPNSTSKEKKLEKAIAALKDLAWANQVPTASGLLNGKRNKHNNIDLVHKKRNQSFELIELKVNSNTPLFAAMEVLQYGLLYLFTRLYLPITNDAAHPALSAKAISLQVLAPANYYKNYDLKWLETELTQSLQSFVAKHRVLDLNMSLSFKAFATMPSIIDKQQLLNALNSRQPVQWK